LTVPIPEDVKFLLVDDRKQNLFSLEQLLRRPGLMIYTAGSGKEGLEMIMEHEFALAILDVQMPEMDGFELAELMRGTRRARQIPIIFLTAGAMDERRRFKGYEAGAVDFLFKPIEPEILRGKASVFYDLCRQRQELARQRDELRIVADQNEKLYREIRTLNETLEEKVQIRTTELLEANEQLQGFTYSVAHDFRQHIRGISVRSSMLLTDAEGLEGQDRKSVERIKDLAHEMAHMTDELLNSARISRQELQMRLVDVSELAGEVALIAADTYSGVGYRIEPGIVVYADPILLRIVLQNLIDNAFKYSQHGDNPCVEVIGEDGGFLVQDNGIGFDMAFSEKIWQPFERLLPRGQYGGTGIGLANVSRIVKRHGGTVWANSEVGKGSVFHVSLPVQAAMLS